MVRVIGSFEKFRLHQIGIPLKSGGGGNTPTHYLNEYVPPTERGRDFTTGYPFKRRFLEQGIIFPTHESSSFVSNHLKLFKDRLLLKIRFNLQTF